MGSLVDLDLPEEVGQLSGLDSCMVRLRRGFENVARFDLFCLVTLLRSRARSQSGQWSPERASQRLAPPAPLWLETGIHIGV